MIIESEYGIGDNYLMTKALTTIATYIVLFIFISCHDNDTDILLVHHAPEVINS